MLLLFVEETDAVAYLSLGSELRSKKTGPVKVVIRQKYVRLNLAHLADTPLAFRNVCEKPNWF